MNMTFSNGYALLVGVGSDLPVTVKDATALHDVLANPSRAAYPPDQIELLTEANANRQSILNAFDKLIEQVNSNPDATVIIYFSGHGVQVEQPNTPTEYFLLPYGYDSNFWANTAISGLEFTKKIEAIKARKLVVLLDCCHAAGIPALKAPDEVAIKSVPLPPNLLNILETGSGRVVVASSRKDEYSYTGTPYSVFTACLLDALAGKGAKKQDGFARILDVLSYLIEQVPQRASGSQHPCVNRVHNLTDDFPLCYYAGGSKYLPTASNSLPPWKRKTLEERRDMLREGQKLVREKLKRVRGAWIIEMNPATKFQQEMQIQEDETTLLHLDTELDEIEQKLQ